MEVYILTDGRNYKIGFTNGRVQTRMKQLQTGNGEKISLVGIIENADESVEKYWHMRFCHKRCPGGEEWFSLDQSDIETILGDKRNEQQEYGPDNTNCNVEGFNRFDVRQVPWRHQDKTANRKQDVFYAGREKSMHTIHEYNVIPFGKKHDFYRKDDRGEVVE